nr:transketolase C-terminal domain-containing protein [Prolixibacteraceae bacterium]
IYSSFSQRAYDQIVHDVAIQNLNVVLCLDRGGLVGADGATHHGVFDMAFLNCVPNLSIASPLNETELRNLLYTAQLKPSGPLVIRYPRGRGVTKNWQSPFNELEIGKGQCLKQGSHIAVLSIGHIGNTVSKAIDTTSNSSAVAHFDMRYLKPIDSELLHTVFSKYKTIITVEDGTIVGGLGSTISSFMNKNGYKSQIISLGIPDNFIEHGEPDELYRECGIDSESIAATIEKCIKDIAVANA